eukprot:4078899-Prorocentrum_lima.AAC.1
MRSRREEVEGLQVIAYNLMQEIKDAEDRIALGPPRNVDVAKMQAYEELQEATRIIHATSEEET